MDSGEEKVPKEDFELSSDDELDLGIYLLIKAGGQKKKKKRTQIIKLCRLQLLTVPEVSSPALTSAGPFL